MRWIQLIYDNSFCSIWEYDRAIRAKETDWRSVIGTVCPLCGREGGYREITAYEREAIELFPFRRGMIPVARFVCRDGHGTFSLLPWQLAPYHRYTIESMVLAVLLWRQVLAEDGGGAGAAVEELPGDSDVTPWLLQHWLGVLVAGLRLAHSALREWYDLDGIRSAGDRSGLLDEVHAYAVGIGGRDPPSRSGLREAMRRYGAAAKRPLAGRLSQER
jgi:hypothetical protein